MQCVVKKYNSLQVLFVNVLIFLFYKAREKMLELVINERYACGSEGKYF